MNTSPLYIYLNRAFWSHVDHLAKQLSRLTEQEELKDKLEGAISLSFLKMDTMSVHSWLKRCSKSGHTCMQDLIYAYHGLTPLLRVYQTKMQSHELADTDPQHAHLIQLLAVKLPSSSYNFTIINVY